MRLTPEEIEERTKKVQKYRNGEYKVKPPPVSTVWWNEYDWIKWIDKHGKWTDDQKTD